MSLHPLIDLSVDKEVKKAAGFRAVATELTGETLAEHFQQEIANAPRRHEVGKKYFQAYNARLAASRRSGRDGDHLSLALAEHCRGSDLGLVLPDDEGEIRFLQAQLSLKSAAENKDLGDSDPNKGLGRIDLLGIGPGERMIVAQVKYLAPSATRGGTGDTPLRALLEGLAYTAIAQANRDAIQSEVSDQGGPTFSDEPPALMMLGSPRYWELCRRREAQKGAAWIKELERLGREIEEAIGVSVRFSSFRLEGDPGWSYPGGAPRLDGPLRILAAWEPGAGRVRPKPRPKPKVIDPADLPVEADLSRPVRDYTFTESYLPGDRIDHPTLGVGIVQCGAGNGKIAVLFGEKKSLLVHERAAPSRPPGPPPVG